MAVTAVTEHAFIAVPPAVVYAAVSDPRRMREWSPENTGARLSGPPCDAHIGMTFVGTNRRGPLRWVTRCTVTAADPDERFAFDVHAIGIREPLLPVPISGWEYRFEPAPDGTRVTETWTDHRPSLPGPVWRGVEAVVLSGSTFEKYNRTNIRRTLERLKQDLERAR